MMFPRRYGERKIAIAVGGSHPRSVDAELDRDPSGVALAFIPDQVNERLAGFRSGSSLGLTGLHVEIDVGRSACRESRGCRLSVLRESGRSQKQEDQGSSHSPSRRKTVLRSVHLYDVNN